MLGRFVVGVAKLPELRATVATVRGKEDAWPVSVVAPDAAAATAVLRAPDDANVRIESVEVKAGSVTDVVLISRAAPKTREVYIEMPLDASTPAVLDAVADVKLRAKVRTGGITADAFPRRRRSSRSSGPVSSAICRSRRRPASTIRCAVTID